MNSCLSCAMPLSAETQSKSDNQYCQYCTDESGQLKSREEVQQGIAGWLQQITPRDESTNSGEFMARAGYYMKAMPAWAKGN